MFSGQLALKRTCGHVGQVARQLVRFCLQPFSIVSPQLVAHRLLPWMKPRSAPKRQKLGEAGNAPQRHIAYLGSSKRHLAGVLAYLGVHQFFGFFPLPSLPPETFTLILRFVGAHDLESDWTCAYCNPYWYDWYCEQCAMYNNFLRWTPTKHFGHCGQSCGCCRSEVGEGFGSCEACDGLMMLSATSRRLRSQVGSYDGR